MLIELCCSVAYILRFQLYFSLQLSYYNCLPVNLKHSILLPSNMRKVILVLFTLSYCATIYATITSRCDTIHTPRPQEVKFDPSSEEVKFRGRTGKLKREATQPNQTFSSITPLKGDSNGNALVHYSGAYSSTIFIVTQQFSVGFIVQSNLWRTTNFGVNYTNETSKLPRDAIINYIYISNNASKLLFSDKKNNRIYRTIDTGETYETDELNFDPSDLEFHPSITDSVLAYDEEEGELYISSDFGMTFHFIEHNVSLYTWDTFYTETPVVFYEATDTTGNTYLMRAEIQSDGELTRTVFDTNLGPIEKISLVLTNEFIFVEKQLVSTDTDGKGGLYVSLNRQPFKLAVFPLNSEEQHYLIVSASEGLVLVAVYHYDNLTNLYLSDETGSRYSLSLQNVKGNGISWWRRHLGTVEMVRVEGVRGTFIANRLDPSSNNDHRYWASFTQITYDKGATWGYIQRPAYNADGSLNGNCSLSECYLNLRINQPSRQGVYSKANALGLIAAHGNAGKYLNGYWWGRWFSNVYLSRDGGFSWTEEYNSGAFEYAFLDHGGVVVTVSKYSGYSVYTKSVRYSCTEGLAWVDRGISEQSLYAIGMLTEPGSTTLQATIFAKTPGHFVEWLIIQMNFSVVINTTCSPDDYVDWVPSDARQGGQCLLGEKTTYERRKPEVCCYNGRDYQRLVNTSVCPCSFQDFDCDFGYEKLSLGAPCTPSEGTAPSGPPLECPEGSNYTASLGYRLIPGDKCVGGDYHAYATRVYSCPTRTPTTLLLTPHQLFYRVGEEVRVGLSQGFGSKISTQYLWSFGDGHSEVLTGYDNSRSVNHTFAETGNYTVSLSASNAAGVNNVSVRITVLNQISSVSISSPHIVIVGLNEVFRGAYTLTHGTAYPGTVTYEWTFNGDTSSPLLDPVYTKLFSTPGTVVVLLSVKNEVSSAQATSTIQVHPTSDNIQLAQEGESFALDTLVTLSLKPLDDVSLPEEGVVYRWDMGEGNGLLNTSVPTITFRYPTIGPKVVKVFSVSLSDGSVINHVVTGTIHVVSILKSVTASYVSGTTADSTMANFTLIDGKDGPYIGVLTVHISDDTNNKWTYGSGQVFEVTNGFLTLILSPLSKYTIYKIKVSLANLVSNVDTTFEVSRVKEVDQSVVVTLGWVSIPEGVNVNQWRDQLESTVSQQIVSEFHVEEWRLSVDVGIVENQKYSIFVKLLPNNMTDEGLNELMTSLHEILDFYKSQDSVNIPGVRNIPVISAQINDGSVNTVHEYTTLGVAIGVPLLLVVSLFLIVPLILCSAFYARKYRKVSHAYTRLRQSRASNFTFTQEGLDDDDDEAPVLLQTDSKARFNMEENFEGAGYSNFPDEKQSDV